MSFFGKLFSGKKEMPMTTHEAIQKLRETENLLIKKQEFLEKKIEQELDIAKTNAKKNKRAAIQALKRKQRFDKQLQQIDGTLSTIEMQRESLEDANSNTSIISTMKTAADALKVAHQNLDVDKIQDIMDEVAEQQNVSREISEAISTPIGYDQGYDEAELEKELEDLEQQELDNELLGVNANAHELPDVPVDNITVPIAANKDKKVSAKHIEDDEDLKNLLSWAN